MYQPFPVIINSDYVPMVELIGIHFQIRDDYLNLQSSQVQIKKKTPKQCAPPSFKDAERCTPRCNLIRVVLTENSMFWLLWLIVFCEQGVLRRLNRRQIFIPNHPLYPRRTQQPEAPQ